ncbi:phytoene synthase, putative [Leishmania panamensis]|uniref:Phytoene synthase, putative n=2 Tax=Leishmania guyanensis species complex TaxID=38579 RepID=A0A088S4E6_LEIPA|nr:phytoene synthase, putative [Leishmania panamensis]AIO02500.1 phytoene synthase, putative [Leishmania panamensis]
MRNKEAADYYRALPQNELSKEDMWRRINKASADRAEATGPAIGSAEVDYIKLEDELRNFDLFHYRVGEIAYPDQVMRRDYYAMWNLAMSLNKARWSMLEVHSQRGMKTTGAGMKLIFWKESVGAIMEKRKMSEGQFTDSHPVLRPFAAAAERNPHMTKAFVRGFTDARLRVIQQPGNVQQLFDHFDKFYGYFFNSLLEVTHVKDEAAEHLMTHIGRATGLTNHCVMFWKKYARLGFTMLPADLCADNHVNLGLLKNIPLASRDRAVRKVLFDVMCIVKDEMLHAQKVAKDVLPKAWPIVMECFYANYYLGFLQRRDFDVSALFADHNIENAGFVWYRLKKRWEWERYQSIERLVDESAPLPYINTSFAHRGSQYKMASGVGSGTPQTQRTRS